MGSMRVVRKDVIFSPALEQRSASSKNNDRIADRMKDSMQRAHVESLQSGTMPPKHSVKNAFKGFNRVHVTASERSKQESLNGRVQAQTKLLQSNSDSRIGSSTTSTSSLEDSPRKATAKLLEGLDLNIKNPRVSRTLFLEDEQPEKTVPKIESKSLASNPVHQVDIAVVGKNCAVIISEALRSTPDIFKDTDSPKFKQLSWKISVELKGIDDRDLSNLEHATRAAFAKLTKLSRVLRSVNNKRYMKLWDYQHQMHHMFSEALEHSKSIGTNGFDLLDVSSSLSMFKRSASNAGYEMANLVDEPEYDFADPEEHTYLPVT